MSLETAFAQARSCLLVPFIRKRIVARREEKGREIFSMNFLFTRWHEKTVDVSDDSCFVTESVCPRQNIPLGFGLKMIFPSFVRIFDDFHCRAKFTFACTAKSGFLKQVGSSHQHERRIPLTKTTSDGVFGR